MIGYMANNVLPLRAGEFVRVYVAARRLAAQRDGSLTDSLWLAGATVVVERVLDSLTLVLILGVLILDHPVPAALEYAAAIVLAIDVVAAAALATLALAPDFARRLLARLTRRRPALERRTERGLGHDPASGSKASARRPTGCRCSGGRWWRGHCSATGAWALLRAMHLDLPFVAGWTVMTFVGFGDQHPVGARVRRRLARGGGAGAVDLRGRPGDCTRLRVALPCQSVRPDHAGRVAVPRAGAREPGRGDGRPPAGRWRMHDEARRALDIDRATRSSGGAAGCRCCCCHSFLASFFGPHYAFHSHTTDLLLGDRLLRHRAGGHRAARVHHRHLTARDLRPQHPQRRRPPR